MADYSNPNIEPGIAGVAALLLSAHTFAALISKRVISEDEGQEILRKLIGSVIESQRDETRALLKGILPNAKI